ncbi:Subtilisin-like protease SBT2.2, partial [Bienertia sinuspersici]
VAISKSCYVPNNPDDVTDIYIVSLKQAPTAHFFFNELKGKYKSVFNRKHHPSTNSSTFHKLRNVSRSDPHYGSYIARVHDSLLRKALKGQRYLKLYSYHYLINGFAVLVTPDQADSLSRRREVANVIPDFSVRIDTTYTPEFLGLPKGAWPEGGGYDSAGEGIVIGLVDTGIDPTHPSFSDSKEANAYPIPEHFCGICEVSKDFPSGSCNRKLVGARHFAASAITRGIFNYSKDYASPSDGDGHGTHTASIASGNHGIPVVVAGHHFGNASGMAPRSHLSITPNRRPPGVATFFNPIDMALLTAVKAGIFVVQAAGNTGPAPHSVSSFSPWIYTVGAASHDRIYNNSIILGNNVTLSGVGLASGTNDTMYTLISAAHALCNDTPPPNDMYIRECQDARVSTVDQALQTAKNLSAAGVVFYMDPFVLGFQLNPTPMDMPGIIIPSTNDSKVLLQYYNSSLVRDGTTQKIVKFGAVACISGGITPNYIDSAPKVMYYSARGPDPEDNSFNDADIMKPNLVAPGNSIWGEQFAMMSGTSMAAPHVAGLAALIKKKYPGFSPAAIASALSTTASLHDRNGGPIMAQRAYSNPDANQSPATAFDMGSGFVNATAALDPGLIFDSSYDDYISFLCGINGSAPVVLNYTGQSCDGVSAMMIGSDLNLPSITVSRLNQTRVVNRTVLNVGVNETFRIGWSAPYTVSMKVTPTRFFIAAGEKQVLTISLNATRNDTTASYGRIGLFGDRGHVINFPSLTDSLMSFLLVEWEKRVVRCSGCPGWGPWVTEVKGWWVPWVAEVKGWVREVKGWSAYSGMEEVGGSAVEEVVLEMMGTTVPEAC